MPTAWPTDGTRAGYKQASDAPLRAERPRVARETDPNMVTQPMCEYTQWKVVLYVPTDTDAPHTDMRPVPWLQGFFTSAFGGTTTVDGRGTWGSPDGDVPCEDVTMVTSVAPEHVDKSHAKSKAQEAARGVANGTTEDAVMWELQPTTRGFETSGNGD